MAEADAKRAWVKQVLGVDIAAGDTGPDTGGLPAALAAWEQALEAVDGQIGALQNLLRGSPDEGLREIAEFGLNAMTGSHKVKLRAALMDVSANPAKAGAAARLAGAFAAHLSADKRVAAVDANPFGVALSIRATLVPALNGLQTALRQGAG